PNPVTSCGATYIDRYNNSFPPNIGMPIYVEFDPNASDITSANATFKRGTTTLPSCVVTGTSYTNPDPNQQNLGRAILNSYNALFVVPRDPLSLSTTYSLTVNTNLGSLSTTVHVGGA